MIIIPTKGKEERKQQKYAEKYIQDIDDRYRPMRHLQHSGRQCRRAREMEKR